MGRQISSMSGIPRAVQKPFRFRRRESPCESGLLRAAQQRFVTAFLEETHRLNTQPLHLVLEEIDEFAPQTGAPGTERMLGAVARIFQRGRRKGFRAIAITQRPANAHKRVLAQCNALVTLRLVAPQVRKAVAEWIRGHADDEVGQQVADSLPKLGRGEGWVWAPEQDVLERATFPAIKTFDSLQAPEEGESCEPASWAEVDLEVIKAELTEAVEEGRANDPKALRARSRGSGRHRCRALSREARPLVCLVETSKQLVAETRTPVPMSQASPRATITSMSATAPPTCSCCSPRSKAGAM